MKKSREPQKNTTLEIVELIIKAVVAAATLISAIRWW